MKRILTILMILVFAKAGAQNFIINFTANGVATGIDSVKVQNLNQGTSLTIAGTDTLQLLGAVGVNNILIKDDKPLQIYPNPSELSSIIKFEKIESGPTAIEIFNISGKRIIHSDFDLAPGEHQFQISNLNPGLHQVVVSSPNYIVTGKIVSHYAGNEEAEIREINSNRISLKGSRINAATVYETMQYNQGDILLATAFFGNYKSVKTAVPTASGLLSFTFFACTDLDNNHYGTVQIGTQTWMAENLKTSKYRNGDLIPTGLSNSQWQATTTGAYALYENASPFNKIYGKLYNWYAVLDTRKLCPTGWHVPSDAEWTNLENFLGGASEAGRKMKSTASLWGSSNPSATNESGFSGLPGGYRIIGGQYGYISGSGYWWSSTGYLTSTIRAWCRGLYYGNDLGRYDFFRQSGLSCRCLKD